MNNCFETTYNWEIKTRNGTTKLGCLGCIPFMDKSTAQKNVHSIIQTCQPEKAQARYKLICIKFAKRLSLSTVLVKKTFTFVFKYQIHFHRSMFPLCDVT
ncbi:unnamed protein product [Ilex paraguariensis]|uniref:Uncharacterized protein n=1 Tax=Ilex paraguariensis TaxID=185542 RepID=A0ABC8RVL6_9AQUA